MRQKHSDGKRENLAYLFILPFGIFYVLFKLYPLVYGMFVSVLDQNTIKKLSQNTFVAGKNFAAVFASPDFWRAGLNSLEYSVIYVLGTLVLSLALAMFLHKKFRGIKVVRTFYYLPYVSNLIAIGLVWKFLLDPFDGPINSLLLTLGIPSDLVPEWLQSVEMALPTVAGINIWVTLAFSTITILAALPNISPEIYEASLLEGAKPFQVFGRITLPLLMPTCLFLVLINTINSFKNYTTVVALTNGGPGNATDVTTFQIFQDAFKYYKFSYAAAEAVVLTVFLILFTVGFQRLQKSWDRAYDR